MATETILVENTTSSLDWFEIGDASHDHVHVCRISDGQQETVRILIQPTKPDPGDDHPVLEPVRDGSPSAGLARFSGFLRVSNANEKIWLRLEPTRKLFVIRGDARIS